MTLGQKYQAKIFPTTVQNFKRSRSPSAFADKPYKDRAGEMPVLGRKQSPEPLAKPSFPGPSKVRHISR